MKIEYEVLLEVSEKLVTIGHTVHTFMNGRGKPVRPPEGLLSVMENRLSKYE